MKALIIEEKDVQTLLDRLELQNLRLTKGQFTEDTIHRFFHGEVVKWFQEQGWKK